VLASRIDHTTARVGRQRVFLFFLLDPRFGGWYSSRMNKPGPKKSTKIGKRVLALLDKGVKRNDIAAKLDVTPQLVDYYKRCHRRRK
jgi:DNA-binding NarL/FixJ family response regulator